MRTGDMKLVLAILMPLLRLSYGFLPPGDTVCNATLNATCTVTYGGNIFSQMMNSATEYRLHFKKLLTDGSREVFSIKKGVLSVREEAFKNRTEVFVDNGTIKIQNVQWEDAGQYSLEIYYTNGTYLRTVQMNLEVKVNPWPIVVVGASAVGALLLVILISCCIHRKVKTRNQSNTVI